MELLTFTAIFFFIALAAKKIGGWFSKIGLPYITGYLLTGMVAGPFILDLLPSEATTTLRYIDELALGIIAFVAGSELYLKEIRSRIRSIGSIAGGFLAEEGLEATYDVLKPGQRSRHLLAAGVLDLHTVLHPQHSLLDLA